MLVTRARDTSSYFAFCNLVGGQDELVFDGHSVVLDDAGEVIARAPRLRGGAPRRRPRPDRGDRPPPARRAPARARPLARARAARRGRGARAHAASTSTSVAGVDHVLRARARADAARAHARPARLRREERLRRRRRRVSGGIDSAVTAALCADALGPERVHCVSMPSRFSSEGTRDDARRRRGERSAAPSARSRSSPSSARSTRRSRSRSTGGLAGLAAENLQARVRGVLLMALSNTYGWLVVSTGNKSELAVGYSTLYGDMVGASRSSRTCSRRTSTASPST